MRRLIRGSPWVWGSLRACLSFTRWRRSCSAWFRATRALSSPRTASRSTFERTACMPIWSCRRGWTDIDWSAEFPARDMSGLVAPASWIAFGWGDRGFMLTTPTWADLRPGTAFIALSGLGRGAMHVEYVDSPGAYDARRVRLSAEQYRRLAAFIRDSFVRDAGGAVRRIDAPGYFDTDAFYEARADVYVLEHLQRVDAACAGGGRRHDRVVGPVRYRGDAPPAGRPDALSTRRRWARRLSSSVGRSPVPCRRLRRRSAFPSASAGTCGHARRPD